MIAPQHIYQKTADQMGLPLKLVEKVNNFYWKKGVKEAVESCEDVSVYIKNIGTLFGSIVKTRKEIKAVIKVIRRMRAKEPKTERDGFKLKKMNEVLEGLLKMRNNIALQKLNKTAQKWDR